MNVLSLFDGISCGRVALERSGIPVENYFASEIDKYAIQISNKNYPDTIHLGDIRNIDVSGLPGIDLLLAGSPCQGFSQSGVGLGFDDPRSVLFFEFLRIKELIKPKWFLLENVKMKKQWLDKITELVKINPIMLNSSLVSAQQRERVYWTDIPALTSPEDQKIMLKDILEDGFVDRNKSLCLDANYGKGSNLRQYFVKRRRQIVFTDFEKFTFWNQTKVLDGVKKDFYRILTPIECERLQTLPDNYTDGVPKTQRYKCLGNGWTVDVVSHVLSKLV